jgi:hypothetical protein
MKPGGIAEDDATGPYLGTEGVAVPADAQEATMIENSIVIASFTLITYHYIDDISLYTLLQLVLYYSFSL